MQSLYLLEHKLEKRIEMTLEFLFGLKKNELAIGLAAMGISCHFSANLQNKVQVSGDTIR